MVSKLLIVGCFIWGIFSPFIASSVFIGFVAIYELLIFARHQHGKGIKIEKLNDYENAIARKFNLPVRYPFMSASQSKTLILVALLSIPWVVLLIINNQYIQAGIIFANLYVANYLARLLNPSYFGNKHRKDSDANMDYEDFIDVMIKLHPEWSNKHEAQKNQGNSNK